MTRNAARFAVITIGLGAWLLIAHAAVAAVVWAVGL
jgi:hypothetical protein